MTVAGKRSLKIDPSTRELVFESGRLVWLSGLEAIKQSVEVRLRFFLAEWFLDETAGIDWRGKILGRKFDATRAEQVVRQGILETPGISSVLTLKVSFDAGTRLLTVTWAADTDLGQLDGSVKVTTL